MKCMMLLRISYHILVAPLAGAWIEIYSQLVDALQSYVAPLAGAWIEIEKEHTRIDGTQSLPSRERGLKSVGITIMAIMVGVAPLAGAWIEILSPFCFC